MRREFLEPSSTDACKKCPLYYEKHGRTHFVPTEVRRNEHDEVDILVVGEAPGKDEDERGAPAVGKSGQLLRGLINHVHGSEIGVAYTNAIRCMYGPKKWKESSAPKALKVCRTYLHDDIEALNPKVIIPMGTGSIASILKDDTASVSGARGGVKRVPIRGEDRTVVCTNHPSAAFHSPGLVSIIKSDIRRSSMIAKYGYDDDLPSARPGKAVLISDLGTLEELVNHILFELSEEDVVTIDLEGANLNKKYGNALATVQLAWTWKTGYVIPYDHPESPWTPKQKEKVKELLIKLFTYKKPSFRFWVAHNKSYEDMLTRSSIGVFPKNRPFIDTMHMIFMIDENRLSLREKKGKSLDPFSLEYLVVELLECHLYTRYEKDVLRKNIMTSPLSEVVEYGAKDVYLLRRLYDVLIQICEPDYLDKMMNLAEKLYAPASHAFFCIETNGFYADRETINSLLDKRSEISISGRVSQIERDMRSIPAFIKANDIIVKDKLGSLKTIFRRPWVFDLGKPAHQEVLFFDVLQLESVDETKNGKPSIGKKFRAEYWNDKDKTGVPEVGIFNEWKELKTMENTFLVSLKERLDPKSSPKHEDSNDSRVRSSYGLTNTVTARTNSYDLNLQQIPRADNPVKKSIKNIFRAQPSISKRGTNV